MRSLYCTLTVLLCLFGQAANAFDDEAFFAKLEVHSKVYDAFREAESTRELMVQGRMADANAKLVSLVPDARKTVHDYFLLGNMLFVMDPEASYRYMKLAEQRDSNNPYILFERGIHEHRLGHFAEARKYYQRVSKSAAMEGHAVLIAYLVHTLLMTGEPEQALKLWPKARFGSNHTRIEKGMYTVFSTRNQERERADLIGRIRAGETVLLCDLLDLDSHWETDWWNYGERKDYLAFDQQLAAEVIKPGSPEEGVVDVCAQGASLAASDYVKRLDALGILKGRQPLPASPVFVYHSVRHVLGQKVMTEAEVLDAWESRLNALSKQSPEGRRYYDVLAHLYVATRAEDKLRKVDDHGWHVLHEDNYALSYVAGLPEGSPEQKHKMAQAMEDFPNSARLAEANLGLQGKTRDAMTRFIAAQFADVKNNWSGPYRLSDYMASLAHEMGRLK